MDVGHSEDTTKDRNFRRAHYKEGKKGKTTPGIGCYEEAGHGHDGEYTRRNWQ